MADSPYIPDKVKQYVRKYQLQKKVNSLVNQVIKDRPEDPFGFMIGILQKSASSAVQIINLKAFEHVSGEGFATLKILARVSYLNNQIQFFIAEPLGILDDQAIQFDTDRINAKGISKAIAYFNDILAPKVVHYKCSQQSDIDKILQASLQESAPSNLYAINTMSYSLPRITAHATSQPLYKVIADLADNPSPQAQYMVNCLEGGKAIGSKCKVFKYMVISNKQKHDPFICQNILANIRKSIVGGKGGQAALKFSTDRTFVCPVDTIMDNFKIIEEAIIAANGKQTFSIGLSWAADTLYTADTKKYELENPKTPFDNDQMIDYLVKLVIDKPIISYLQDPIASSQKGYWKKLRAKLDESEGTRNVRLGSRSDKLLNIQAPTQELKNSLTELSIPATNDSHPDLTPQQLQQKNADKFNLDYIHSRAFDLKTLTKVLSVQKVLAKSNTRLILQDNFYETYDTTLVDVCIGANAVANISSINQGKYDRLCKLGRINEIFQLRQ